VAVADEGAGPTAMTAEEAMIAPMSRAGITCRRFRRVLRMRLVGPIYRPFACTQRLLPPVNTDAVKEAAASPTLTKESSRPPRDTARTRFAIDRSELPRSSAWYRGASNLTSEMFF
jgi:hypothetical protein